MNYKFRRMSATKDKIQYRNPTLPDRLHDISRQICAGALSMQESSAKSVHRYMHVIYLACEIRDVILASALNLNISALDSALNQSHTLSNLIEPRHNSNINKTTPSRTPTKSSITQRYQCSKQAIPQSILVTRTLLKALKTFIMAGWLVRTNQHEPHHRDKEEPSYTQSILLLAWAGFHWSKVGIFSLRITALLRLRSSFIERVRS